MKGILFKPWKIKAIADNPDREWQTRRVIKPQPPVERLPDFHGSFSVSGHDYKPRYQVGEVVYIKEACSVYEGLCDWRVIYNDNQEAIVYPPERFISEHLIDSTCEYTARTTPAWTARYFIRIKDVRAERLQSITEEDAIAEGVTRPPNYSLTPYYIEWFRWLWNRINKLPFDWQSNPWVWVYTFEQEKPCFYSHENMKGSKTAIGKKEKKAPSF